MTLCVESKSVVCYIDWVKLSFTAVNYFQCLNKCNPFENTFVKQTLSTVEHEKVCQKFDPNFKCLMNKTCHV